jgi:membrane-bound serine protease (ClpP class)
MSSKALYQCARVLFHRLTAQRFARLLLISLPLLGVVHYLFENAQAATPATRTALWLDIQGVIGPATSEYITRALDNAASNSNIEIVILRMDTPGGLDSSMRKIIQHILSSPVPVVAYVSPSGARAASAGTYILYASNVAAMAPATNLGAATPVQIGGVPSVPGGNDKNKSKQQNGGDNESAMTHKIVNDAAAYIRSLAEMRGRNADWAEKAVREAVSLTAKQALKLNVIDLIATDMSDLLQKLDGRTVVVSGQETVLQTAGLVLKHEGPGWRSKFLAVITNPNVAYILMLIGIYGLVFEFSNPGAVLPGVAGAISLILALYAFQVLPVNYTGFGLIMLGIALMVAEAFVPSFGALGIGGVIAFVFGSIILMDTGVPGYSISLPLIAGVALVSSGLFTLILVMVLRSRRHPVVSGQEEMLNTVAVVQNDFETEGKVRAHSEIWNARSPVPVTKGQKVRVAGMEGLTLLVKPVGAQEEEKHHDF